MNVLCPYHKARLLLLTIYLMKRKYFEVSKSSNFSFQEKRYKFFIQLVKIDFGEILNFPAHFPLPHLVTAARSKVICANLLAAAAELGARGRSLS